MSSPEIITIISLCEKVLLMAGEILRGRMRLWKLDMRCSKSSPSQSFVACNIFGVRYEKKRKERLTSECTPRQAGGKCLIKSVTSEKCLDIAITATSTKSHSCAILEFFYIYPSFILPIIFSSSIPTYGTHWLMITKLSDRRGQHPTQAN